jgi:hypothetical protein
MALVNTIENGILTSMQTRQKFQFFWQKGISSKLRLFARESFGSKKSEKLKSRMQVRSTAPNLSPFEATWLIFF